MKITWTKMVVGLAGTLLAACGGSTAQYDAEEVVLDTTEQAITCGGSAATCGYVMATLDTVGAKSNGANMQTGNSCAGSGTYGLQYQCVEYARRYWNLAKNHTFAGVTYACNICDLTPSTTDPRQKWIKYTTGYTPVRGDLIVKPCVSGGPGHVAVVSSSTSTTASVVEQNNSCTGTNSISLSSARCILHPI